MKVYDDGFLIVKFYRKILPIITFDFDHLLYKDFIQFFHGHIGLISLANTADTSLQSQTGFRFKMYQGLNATAQVNIDWDNAPAPGVKNTDTAYIFTLGYQF